MDYQNGSTCLIKRENEKGGEKLENIRLKDAPLELRRIEAKEPLFLTRYE